MRDGVWNIQTSLPHQRQGLCIWSRRRQWRSRSKARQKASLGVLVLSYPWLDWFHPDRLGAQLRRLLPFLKAMLAEAKCDSPHCTVRSA